MNIANLSISEISNLYKNKELKPSEVYKEVFTNASLSESIVHAHLKLFQDEATEASKLSDERYEKGNPLSDIDGIPIAIKIILILKIMRLLVSSKMLF
jgi:Asp-tRNAAsn/Glu-tRNAGln amidotransferase A subunit and related amidases